MNVAEELTQNEKEILEWDKWYFFITSLKEPQIKLFFKRMRDIQLQRISAGNFENKKEILQTLRGISFVEMKFLQIKKEVLTKA